MGTHSARVRRAKQAATGQARATPSGRSRLLAPVALCFSRSSTPAGRAESCLRGVRMGVDRVVHGNASVHVHARISRQRAKRHPGASAHNCCWQMQVRASMTRIVLNRLVLPPGRTPGKSLRQTLRARSLARTLISWFRRLPNLLMSGWSSVSLTA